MNDWEKRLDLLRSIGELHFLVDSIIWANETKFPHLVEGYARDADKTLTEMTAKIRTALKEGE